MLVYLNGQIVPREMASISAFDHGFLYGVGLFETFRIYEGHAFLLEDHLQRLNDGLEQLCIEKRFSKEEVLKALKMVLEANHLQNAYIRLNVSAGIGELGLQVESYMQPNTIIYSKPLPKQSDNLQEKRLKTLTIRRNTPEGNYRLKSHHFLNNVLAKRELGNQVDVEGIFLNGEGYLSEGVVSNLFWIQNQTVFTPSVNTGILNGITRQFVIELIKKNGLKVVEGQWLPSVLEDAEEVFITNSIQEIVGVKEWDNRRYPGMRGELTHDLHKQYCRLSSSLFSRHDLK
jgi:4-amino-4-deoxychorismate lyase